MAPMGGNAGPAPGNPGQSFGNGPVRVALLLPLTGDAALAAVGISMANAAQLAMDYVQASPKIGDNITLVLKDTGASTQGASAQASAAVAEGAALILRAAQGGPGAGGGCRGAGRQHPAHRLFQQQQRGGAGCLSPQRAPGNRVASQPRLCLGARPQGHCRAFSEHRLWPVCSRAAYLQTMSGLGLIGFAGRLKLQQRRTTCAMPSAQLAQQLEQRQHHRAVHARPRHRTRRRGTAAAGRRAAGQGATHRLGRLGQRPHDCRRRPTSPAPFIPTVDDAGYRALSAEYTAKLRQHAASAVDHRLHRRLSPPTRPCSPTAALQRGAADDAGRLQWP